MQQLKNYIDKVEEAVANAASKSRKQRGSGLLSTTKQEQMVKPTTDIETVAAFIVGIRKAKEEVMNGNA